MGRRRGREGQLLLLLSFFFFFFFFLMRNEIKNNHNKNKIMSSGLFDNYMSSKVCFPLHFMSFSN
jgi:hypothetical protein